MALSGRVFVVTGSNKGIGFAIVKALCQKLDAEDVVYLTARSVDRGTQAVKELESQGLKPRFHLLDVEDKGTINAFAEFLKKEHGGLDVLINNAGILFRAEDDVSKEKYAELAEKTIKTNYFGFLSVCQVLFPLLRSHGRVVNVSSGLGFLGRIPGEHLRKKLSSDSAMEEDITQLMQDYVRAAKTSTHLTEGWPNWHYCVSKAGVSALSRIQQRQFDADSSRKDMIVNHCHPGFVSTDMNNFSGVLTSDQGAVAPVYLATLPKGVSAPRGQYVWHDTQIVDWVNGPLPAPGY